MGGEIGGVWGPWFRKQPPKPLPPILIKDDSPQVNLANDQSDKYGSVHCWCHGSKIRWGSYTLDTGRKMPSGIIPLEFEIAERGNVKLKGFELEITFGSHSQGQQDCRSVSTITNCPVYLVPGTRPWPRCVDDLFVLSKREWNLLFKPELSIMEQGISMGEASLPSGWKMNKRWTFDSQSVAVGIYQGGARWNYKVHDFDNVGASKCDWRGAVAVVHPGAPFEVTGHLKLKAYKFPHHFKNKAVPRTFTFVPRAEDADKDLTDQVDSMTKDFEEAYRQMQSRANTQEIERARTLVNLAGTGTDETAQSVQLAPALDIS